MAEQSIGINVWLKESVIPGLERMQKAFQETSRKATDSFNSVSMGKFRNEVDLTQRKIKDLQGDIALLRKFKDVEVEIGVKDAELKAAELRLKYLTSRPYKIKVDVQENWSTWQRNFMRGATMVNKEIDRLVNNTSVFGKFIAIANYALTPLITGLAALGAALTAVASSAVLAAAALGTAFVAALAQAVPAVLLLVAAFARVAEIFKSVQAEEKKATAGADDHTAALDRQRQATQNLIRAQERLSDAHKGLSEARRQAKRDLEDLASAEKRVRIEQENARLAMVGARRSARAALGSGSFLEFEQAQLEVDSSALSASDSARQGARTLQDAARTRANGVEGNERVIQAQRALRDATWALADAHRDLAKAQKDQGTAASAAAEADKKLNDTERGLRNALLELRTLWKDVGRGLTDPIIASFTDMVKSITKILKQPEMMAAARELSRGVASAMRIMFGEATNPRNLDNLRSFMRQGAQNLPQIARGMANLFSALSNLARAGAPILSRLTKGFVEWSKGLKDATENQERLNKKVAGLMPHLRSWLDLLGAIWDLFTEVVSISADSGKGLVDDLTGEIQGWVRWLQENRETAKKFFDDAADAARSLARAVAALVAVLGRSVSFDWLIQLADFFTATFVPGLEMAIKIVWTFSGALIAILGLPIIREITQWAITFAIVAKAAEGLALGLLALKGPIGLLINIIRILALSLKALWLTSFGPYVIVIGGIVIALALLEKKFGIVSKAVEWLKDAAKNVLDWLKDNWKSVLLVVFTGPFGALILALQKWGDDIVDFVKSLPSKLFNAAKDIGGALIDGIAAGLTAAVDALPWGIGGAVKRFLGMDDGPSAQDIQQAFSANAGYVFGQRLPETDSATGGMVPATPGGRRMRLGEGGYDEYVISTDPKYARRSTRLLGEAAGRLSRYPQGGPDDRGVKGGVVPYDRGAGNRAGYYGQPATNIIRGDMSGVNPDLLSWVSDLIRKVNAGGHVWIGTGKVGHNTYVKGTRRVSAHARGQAVDINSDLLPAYGDQTPNEDYPLDRFARLARAGLGLPDGITGTATNARGQVIWRVDLGNQGGNHYHHVHVGWTGSGQGVSVPTNLAASYQSGGSTGPSSSLNSGTTATSERPETKDEYFQRITGYPRGTKGTKFLEKYVDASYATGRASVKKTVSDGVGEAAGAATEAGGAVGGSQAQNIALGRQMAAQYGWTGAEWDALRRLWMNESGWSTSADNPTSDAYGIPQAITSLHKLPSDYRTNPRTQIEWGLNYIKNRYGSPTRALAFWNRTDARPYPGHWYSTGGEIPGREGEPRTIVGHAGEMIINRGQQAMLGGAKFLRSLFKQRPDTGHFAEGGEITSRLNVTRDEAVGDLAGLNAAVRRVRVGKSVRTVGNLVKVLNILFEQIEERLTVLSTNVEAARKRMEIRGKVKTFAFRGGQAVQLADSAVAFMNNLGDIQEQSALIQQQIQQTNKAYQTALAQLRAAQAFARKNPRSGVAERRLQQAEKAVNLFGGQLQDLAGARADLAGQEISLRQEGANRAIAQGGFALQLIDNQNTRTTARGGSALPGADARIAQMRVNGETLRREAEAAFARGDTDFGGELARQLDDLSAAIVQAEQDRISTAVSEVNEARGRADRRLDLGERIAKFFGQDISGLIDQRISEIRNQIGGLTAQLGAAVASGNTTLADQLRTDIGELNQEINEQYRRKFDEAREQIDKQFTFASGMNDVALSIAQLSGPGFTPNLPGIVAALQGRASLLNDRGAQLQRQLSGAYQTGDQDLIRDLTLAIEENKLAILQNSQALTEATGALTDQTWTSTAWEQFRVAIFDGLGGLVPGMTVPALATGGFIKREGLFKLHAGEAVVPASDVPMMGGDTNVTIYSPSPVIDPRTVAESVGYALRTRGMR